jgi:hypothetical protein
MSQEGLEVVRRWIEAYNRRDIDGLLGLSDVDIEFRSIFAAIETGAYFAGGTGCWTTSRRSMTPMSGSRLSRKTSSTLAQPRSWSPRPIGGEGGAALMAQRRSSWPPG